MIPSNEYLWKSTRVKEIIKNEIEVKSNPIFINLAIDIAIFNIFNICFLERKKNIIIQNGIFCNILYSDQNCVFNGVYIHYSLISNDMENFIQIEYDIIEYYKSYYCCEKEIVYSLYDELQIIKTKKYPNSKYVIKISGIWETRGQIGLSLKLL